MAILRPAIAPSPILPWQRICRLWIILAKFRGRSIHLPRNGTCGSSRGRRSARCSPIACRASHRRPPMPSSTFKTSPRDDIAAHARAEGFDVVRFAAAAAPPLATARLERFLEIDRHGTMDWILHNAQQRGDPLVLWPAAKTIIILGINYAPDHDPLASLGMADRGAISVYAQGDDYHDVIKKKLRRLAGHIAEGYKADVKLFVDTAPVMEKPI